MPNKSDVNVITRVNQILLCVFVFLFVFVHVCQLIMQDKDLFDGVIGKYTDRFGENGIKKDDDMEIATKLSAAQRPRKLDNDVYHTVS